MTALRPLLFIAALAIVASLGAAPSFAADWRPYTPEALAAAQKDGKSVLVDISAPWCPTCRAQKPILENLTLQPEFKDMIVLEVDFDSQKDDVRALKATSQSTLIAYKGDKETSRSVGDTKKDSIADLMKSAL